MKAAKDAGVIDPRARLSRKPATCPSSKPCSGWPTTTGGYRKEVRVAACRNTRSASSSCRGARERRHGEVRAQGAARAGDRHHIGRPRQRARRERQLYADRASRAGETHTLSAERKLHPDHPAESQRARRLASAPDHLGQEQHVVLAGVIGIAAASGVVGLIAPPDGQPRRLRLRRRRRAPSRIRLARDARRQRLALSVEDDQRAHRPPPRQRHLPAQRTRSRDGTRCFTSMPTTVAS